MAAAVSRRDGALLASLLALFLGANCLPTDVDLSGFSRAILAMTNDTLGAGLMQEYYGNLSYTKVKKTVSAEEVAKQVTLMFTQQQSALEAIKGRVEQVYRNGDFTDREDATQCCQATNLTESREFGLPISQDQSCDRVSGIASKSAYSLYGKLDSTFEDNHRIPLKWQYFGSEKGILNQYPASRPQDCSSYDNRFRPWYKASATPNPKDVVIVIKNNPFPSLAPLFEATDIILRTLNPRDRVALVLYNDGILTNVIGGCYATNLSLATPANVNLFQNMLKTAPPPRDGNTMSEALEAAYKYYDLDLDVGSGMGSGDANETHSNHANITTRDRAIVFLTDGTRVSAEERERTIAVLEKYCVRMTMVSIFILFSSEGTIPREMLLFYNSIVAGVFQGSIQNLIEIGKQGDLRHSITNFYAKFASQAQHSAEFKPVFIVPYYDVFGLEQLVMTLSTPCYDEEEGKLLGVASVDFTVSDIFAAAEYFTQGDLSYAFVIDQDGLVLLHPLLPFPSTTSAAVYLDISTLEPQPGFEVIRESMIRGGSGSMELESLAVLSRGRSIHHGLHFIRVMCNYTWAPIKSTPFSLGVVVPKDSYDCRYSEGTFQSPINARYHMLDLLADQSRLCRQVSEYATLEYSTVALFPEAFSLDIGEELRAEYQYVQTALTTHKDTAEMFKTGTLDIIAATAKAEEVWRRLDSDHSNRNNGNGINDYVAWRYIASSHGVMRIYPGTQIDTSRRKANQYHWYHNAVADVEAVSISPPHQDPLGMGHTISISKAIVRKCVSNSKKKGLQCGVEAVMGIDVALGHIWNLLMDTMEICRQRQRYRCMLIDTNAYIIVHPHFFTKTDVIMSLHLSAFEPFLMHDMFHIGFIKKVYCNNFQYNSKFTRRPRKQFFYEVTDEVKTATAPLEGGHITRCVFYTIVPVKGTNSFFVVVDIERSSKSICKPVSCPCDPEQPCSSLPGFCLCPCVEEIPPENYNSCLESFTGLCAHVCPPLTGLQDYAVSIVSSQISSSVRACYPQRCSEKTTPLECLSSVSCIVVPVVLDNGTSTLECRDTGSVAPTTTPVLEPTVEVENNQMDISIRDAIVWQGISGILVLALIVIVIVCTVYCMRRRRGQVPRRRQGRGRIDTASTNMTSVTTDSSVENSLKRQDSQEQSCSSQEALPAALPAAQKTGIGTVSSITTVGTYVTANDNGGTMTTTVTGGTSSGAKERRALISVWEEKNSRKEEGERGEIETRNSNKSPPSNPLPEVDHKISSSFPDSLGTNGLHLGESPDPSKAGGIWF